MNEVQPIIISNYSDYMQYQMIKDNPEIFKIVFLIAIAFIAIIFITTIIGMHKSNKKFKEMEKHFDSRWNKFN